MQRVAVPAVRKFINFKASLVVHGEVNYLKVNKDSL